MKITVIDWENKDIYEVETTEIHYKDDGLYYLVKSGSSNKYEKIELQNIMKVDI